MAESSFILKVGHSSRGITKCSYNHITDPRSSVATCCTTCVICGEAIGSNFLLDRIKSHRIYYHQGCAVCPIGYHLRSISLKMRNNEEIEVSLNCLHKCKVCDNFLCRKVPYIKLDREFVHNKCTKISTCCVCRSSSTGEDLITDGDFIRHRKCIPSNCVFCGKSVPPNSNLGPLGDKLKQYGHDAHSACLAVRNCSNCGLHDNDMLYDGKEFRHLECSSEVCSLCRKIIGKDVSVAFSYGNSLYHYSCVEKQKCVGCDKILNKGIILSDDGKIFYHSTCDPSLCQGCFLPIGKITSRVINNLKYHMGCGPKCKICNVARENDSEDLKMVEKGIYLHEVCSTEPCLLCGSPLGHPSNTFMMKFAKGERFVHKVCLTPCNVCGDRKIIIKRKDLPLLDAKNRPFLRNDIKQSFASLLVGIKYGKVLSAKKVPKDVLFLILEAIINKSNKAYESLPFVLNGEVDMRMHCTPYRCKSTYCKTCGSSDMRWSLTDYTRCSNTTCILKFKAMRRIATEILEIPIDYDWPKIDSTLLLKTAFLKKGWSLSHEKVCLYNAMMISLKI